MRTMSSGEAQNRFGQLLDTAQHETVSITRHGRPTAFLISAQDMAELLDARHRRGRATAELEAWLESTAGRSTAAAAALTDEEVNRLVHETR